MMYGYYREKLRVTWEFKGYYNVNNMTDQLAITTTTKLPLLVSLLKLLDLLSLLSGWSSKC